LVFERANIIKKGVLFYDLKLSAKQNRENALLVDPGGFDDLPVLISQRLQILISLKIFCHGLGKTVRSIRQKKKRQLFDV